MNDLVSLQKDSGLIAVLGVTDAIRKAQIETALDVNIARRGERFTIEGKAPQARTAAKLLQRFYSEANDHLSLEDVQLGLIEAGASGNDGDAVASGAQS